MLYGFSSLTDSPFISIHVCVLSSTTYRR